MNSSKRKTLYSLAAAVGFLVIAAGSSSVNKIHCGAFSRAQTGEETSADNYVVLNDGSKVFGDKISWKSGLLVKDQIKVGDEKFAIRETKGYFANGNYYGRINSSNYAKRIIHGKLNVYYTEDWTTYTTTNSRTGAMRTSQRLVCIHYVQRGDNGPIEAIANQKDIREYVKDCPASMEMVDKRDKEIRRAIRRNGFYLNKVFVIYNNGCKDE
ncbi:MAG: hypothetical protein JNJ86_14420 [Chitinophagaceae bacterium]|jgi:hypothetical protein|nr:hypothetical protein [Chitinophagaceae bacterium]